MISASESLKNVFYNNTTVKTGVGCTIEYNMNSLIDGIAVTSATPDTAYTSPITYQYYDPETKTSSTVAWPTGKPNPFKKLFPVDSIIKPFRPATPGIKYFVLMPSPNQDTPTNSFSNYRLVQYPNTQPRVYYPGLTTTYKYWLGAVNTNVDLTVTYKQASNPVAGNKAAMTNKIVIKFEKYHVLPSSYTVTVTPSSGSAITTTSVAPPSDGIVTLYYNGTTWTTTKPSAYATPISVNSIRLQAINPGGNRMIGVIEISARWIKDISSDVVSFQIAKESSSSSEDIIPVGKVTANSMSIETSRYNSSELKTAAYNRLQSSFNTDITYLTKNAEMVSWINVIHPGASNGSYDIVPQGTFYIDSYSISDYGDASITALDGSKYLMETLCPDVLCEQYPVTAIIRRLLDSVGFTNYNFNLHATAETSIPQVAWFYTDDTKTVWETIQELCQDIQMNAVMDENNVMQFYSRDYLYSKSNIDWSFYYDKDGDKLPNIEQFSQNEIASANFVKVLWKTPLVSSYTGSSTYLWESPTSFLSAGGLVTTITDSSTEFVIDTKTIDAYGSQQSFYNFEGYVMIDSEVIEFDAIGYDYTALDGTKSHLWISSQADVSKYRALSKPGYEDINKPETAYFKPSGRYRIKSRGALGTKKADHNNGQSATVGWYGRLVSWT